MNRKTNKCTFWLLVISFNVAYSQISINQLDQRGKKTGYWKMFYNEQMQLIDDSLSSIYSSYEYYVNGDPFRYVWSKNIKAFDKIVYAPKAILSDPKLLNGELIYTDKNNNVQYREEFENGIVLRMHAYWYSLESDNKSYFQYHEEFVDFTKVYDAKQNSYYYEKKDYKIFREKWVVKKGYVVFNSRKKQKSIRVDD